MDAAHIYEKVQQNYTSAARGNNSEYGHTVARAFGYTEEELADTPRDANLGLSCGNPLALAKLRESETVIDLGSGAGFDVFLAAKKIGVNGKAIGIDMNREMLERARRNQKNVGANNVSFIESRITEINLPDGLADCIISNCVLNLVPEQEKQLTFNEMFRLLKPGGRVAISDILLKKDLSADLKKSMALYVGCIAGASYMKDYELYFHAAGFNDVLIVDSNYDLNMYANTNEDGTPNNCCASGAANACYEKSPSCCGDELSVEGEDIKALKSNFKGIDFNELAGSFQIYAAKA